MPHPLPASIPDPIFAIAIQARAAGPAAIDGTIGMYMDESGRPFLFSSVRKAVHDIAAELPERPFLYRALLGLPEYREAVGRLVLGKRWTRVASIAATGGTGAVALSLRMAMLMDPDVTLLLPTPTWANHPPLCRSAGIKTMDVPYFSHGQPTVEGIIDGLKRAGGSVAVLLQAGCHNPTGLDFSGEQWTELRDAFRERDVIAILDLAYQGFAGEPEEDSTSIRLMADAGVTTLFAWSGSKNHSLYSERVGLAGAIMPDDTMKAEVEAHFSTITRRIHSASATIGQSIVARTQTQYKQEWLKNMHDVREMLGKKRAILKQSLPAAFHTAIDGRGMFALLPLTPQQIETLQKEHNVFMTGDGRINIAGIPLQRMEELGEKILNVVSK